MFQYIFLIFITASPAPIPVESCFADQYIIINGKFLTFCNNSFLLKCKVDQVEIGVSQGVNSGIDNIVCLDHPKIYQLPRSNKALNLNDYI